MSSAVVSGVVALMLEARPQLTPAHVKRRVMGTATPLSSASTTATGRGLVNAFTAAGPTDVSLTLSTAPVSLWFASEIYQVLSGQPLVWRDLTSNGGVDSAGTPWTLVSWRNVVWNSITWENLSWESFNWSAVSWEDISWEAGISWEDISWESNTPKDKGRTDDRGGKVLD
jgi:serine protease AprX